MKVEFKGQTDYLESKLAEAVVEKLEDDGYIINKRKQNHTDKVKIIARKFVEI